MATLIERLQHAAVSAIADQRRDLERRPEQLRSLVLELHLKPAGGQDAVRIDEATVFTERALKPRPVSGR